LGTGIESNSKTTLSLTGSKNEDEKVHFIFRRLGTILEGSVQENGVSEDSSEAGASVQFEISNENDCRTVIIEDFIIDNHSKIDHQRLLQ
jgi:hypothetical protein